MKTQTKAAIFLLVFSSINAELVTGSSPPLEFIAGLSFIFLVPFYGIGAIIVNELAARWGKGWPTILLLGAAWGIFEEGVVVMSFFNPGWVDLGPLGDYGRVFGINFVWSLNVTIFHAVWSVGIPILLMRIIFPETKGCALLQKRTVGMLAALLLVTSFVLSVVINKTMAYTVPVPLLLAAVVLLVIVGLIAKKMPVTLFPPNQGSPKRPSRFYLVGLLFSIGYFTIQFVLPNVIAFAIVGILLIVLLLVLAWTYIEKNIGVADNDIQKLALVGGLESVWLFFAFIHEITGSAGMAGISLIAILYIVFLLWCRKRVLNRMRLSIGH